MKEEQGKWVLVIEIWIILFGFERWVFIKRRGECNHGAPMLGEMELMEWDDGIMGMVDERVGF